MKQILHFLTRLHFTKNETRPNRRGQKPRSATTRKQPDLQIMTLFARSIALLTILAFGALLLSKYLRPHEDISVFQTICLTTLGSMTTILAAALRRRH